MGYTHYWDIDREKIKTFKEVIPLLKPYLNKQYKNKVIQFDFDKKKKHVLNSKEIRFNGISDEGHETFSIEIGDPDPWNFCKTARKDYDISVCVVLLTLRHLYPDAFSFSSDGFQEAHTHEGTDYSEYMDSEWIHAGREFITSILKKEDDHSDDEIKGFIINGYKKYIHDPKEYIEKIV